MDPGAWARPGGDFEGGTLDTESIGDRLLRITVWLAFVGAGAVVVGSIVNHYVFDDDVFGLNAALEISFNNWLTVVATFAAALVAALHALIIPARRAWFWILAATLTFLSMDDLVRLHERIGDRIGIDNIEVAVFAPAYVFVFLTVWVLSREAAPRAAQVMRLGLALLAVAVAVDLGTALTPDPGAGEAASLAPVRVAVEEGLEVAGWIMVGGGMVAMVCLRLLAFGSRARGPRPPRPSQGGSQQGDARRTRAVTPFQ
ncbi:MAG: hypothetical protein ACRDK9_00205 [Solirubrobacterales bacterium]